MDFKEIDKIKEEVKHGTEGNNAVPVDNEKDNEPKTFEDATNQALSEFKPTYDKSKSMYENGKDVARTIALNETLKDKNFIEEMKGNTKEEMRSDMNADKTDSKIREQKKFYEKHLPVMMFANLTDACDIHLMRWIFGLTVIPFMLSLIFSGTFNLIGRIFKSMNDLFNAIMGIPEYYKNEQTGELILDENKKPIVKNVKVNLLTKILFWFGFAVICVFVVFELIRHFTGFDIVANIKSLIG